MSIIYCNNNNLLLIYDYRLESYDRNDNFGQKDLTTLEYKMELPPITSYKDLHTEVNIPEISMEQIVAFLNPVGKEIDQKAKDLYINKYVNYVRACIQKELTFIHAEVRAEMKTGLVYKVDISLTPKGTVIECQCECAAGMGPSAHCKHVRCVLFGLYDFSQNKSFVVLTTCTQSLQTFHQAKKHLGSPMKAEDVYRHQKRLKTVDFDPRPENLQNMQNYTVFFSFCTY